MCEDGNASDELLEVSTTVNSGDKAAKPPGGSEARPVTNVRNRFRSVCENDCSASISSAVISFLRLESSGDARTVMFACKSATSQSVDPHTSKRSIEGEKMVNRARGQISAVGK